MKIQKKKFKITIETLTGLHIGVGNDKLQIGGVDSEVIKDPVSKQPYIPGSSLKGKIRCLLETESEEFNGEEDDMLNKCFGFKKTGDKNQSPTRFIFRDLFLIKEDSVKFEKNEINTEFKTEIVIDRNKGTAKDGGLRTIERVPPKVKFEGNLLIRILKDDNEQDLKNVLSKGVELLKNDCLGGSGSRGYGAVEIILMEIN